MSSTLHREDVPTFAGHPAGLFVLFFAEMWERFSYYGMRALLVFYMTKGFLGFGDDRAYDVYSAYTSLVYATPFIGGMLADRLLGARKAVVLGGMLMAAGHLLMTVEQDAAFFGALALLIAGNGFFKPNISTIVGSLYPEHSNKRDAGFTLFYMGINLGAAMAPLLCGYIGETYGWHYGFGLATIGMLIGLAVFVAPTRVTQALILTGALGAAATMLWTQLGDWILLGVNTPVGVALVVAAAVAFLALNRGPLPVEAGAPPDPAALGRPMAGPLTAEWLVYLGTAVAVPLVAMLVQNAGASTVVLSVFGGAAFLFLLWSAIRSDRIERDRLIFVLVMMFFSMLFWAFFELAGSAINNFTDRNIDRAIESGEIVQADVGQSKELPVTPDLLGYKVGGEVVTLGKLEALEKAGPTVKVDITAEHVGMGTGGTVVKASVFQAANPIFILLFGLGFTALWGFLGSRNLEPNTSIKFALGLAQLAAGFGVLWYGASQASATGMVGMSWLLLAYLLHTTGELCLSPVGLSMVTRMSPAKIVSMVMGAWFLATAFSQQLSGVIAKLTSVGGEGEGGGVAVPPPIETVHVYGGVFGQVGLIAAGAALLLFVISPFLHKMMHEDGAPAARGGH